MSQDFLDQEQITQLLNGVTNEPAPRMSDKPDKSMTVEDWIKHYSYEANLMRRDAIVAEHKAHEYEQFVKVLQGLAK